MAFTSMQPTGCTERAIPVKIFFAEEDVKKAKIDRPFVGCLHLGKSIEGPIRFL